ncbi:unnamed protein product [Camellia sinensis]
MGLGGGEFYRGKGGITMRVVVVIKVVVCLLSLLGDRQQHKSLADGQVHYKGVMMGTQDQNRKMGRRVLLGKQETASWWLSEDYSMPRRRSANK